jgi:hypothetical protein
VSAAGESTLFAASAAAVASYIWYPTYFALNHLFRDRQLIQRLEEQGDKGANFRNWGSRVTQTIMGEGIWLAAIIPTQVALVNHLGLSAGAAALATHIPLALSMNAFLITPYRNLSNWMWGLDTPSRGSGAQRGGVNHEIRATLTFVAGTDWCTQLLCELLCARPQGNLY